MVRKVLLRHNSKDIFKDGHVTFRFHLSDEQGHSVDVEETPEYVKESGKNGLHRHFIVSNATAGTVLALKTSLTNLQKKMIMKQTGNLPLNQQIRMNTKMVLPFRL